MKLGMTKSLLACALIIGCGGPLTPDSQPEEQATAVDDVADELNRLTVWDDFSGGFSTAKWFPGAAGPYVAMDGVATAVPGGLRVASAGTNPTTGKPAFSITLGQEQVNGGIPSVFDHAKWLTYTTHTATSGYPGFDTLDNQVFACGTRLSGQTFGTQGHPFGANVSDANDIRLSSVAMATLDFESYMVFDFMLTNNKVYAFYERLPFARTATNNYAAFSYAIPVKDRNKGDAHNVAIMYSRSTGVARWILDGREVYRVEKVGYRLSSRKNLLIDLGGTDQLVKLNQLNCGMGAFTMLDGSFGTGRGLARISGMTSYFVPGLGEPSQQSFVDESSQPGSRLFGQGAEFTIGPFLVTSSN